MSGPTTVQTKYNESNKYDLGPISDISNYPGSELPSLQKPPTFDAGCDVLCRVVEEENAKILKLSGLRSEIRKLVAAILYAIDFLSAEITDVETVHEG